MAKYLVDGKRTMSGTSLLAFAQKRWKDNNKGHQRPKNSGQAVSFLRTSVKGAGKGARATL